MWTWILNNGATLLVGVLLLAVVAAILVYMVRNKKKGKSSCGSSCLNCPMGGKCHQKK